MEQQQQSLLNKTNHLNISQEIKTKNSRKQNECETENIFTIKEDSKNNNNENNELTTIAASEKLKNINLLMKINLENQPFSKSKKVKPDSIVQNFNDIKFNFQIKCVRVGDSSHLSDPKNLHDWMRDLDL